MHGGRNPNHHVSLGDILHWNSALEVIDEVSTEQIKSLQSSGIKNKSIILKSCCIVGRLKLKSKMISSTDQLLGFVTMLLDI